MRKAVRRSTIHAFVTSKACIVLSCAALALVLGATSGGAPFLKNQDHHNNPNTNINSDAENTNEIIPTLSKSLSHKSAQHALDGNIPPTSTDREERPSNTSTALNNKNTTVRPDDSKNKKSAGNSDVDGNKQFLKIITINPPEHSTIADSTSLITEDSSSDTTGSDNVGDEPTTAVPEDNPAAPGNDQDRNRSLVEPLESLLSNKPYRFSDSLAENSEANSGSGTQ